ncbi:glycosyltransferase [Candidatus Babeliales bacterium]|nr:glycosyltransferase [Candidatus Babeliales bacterium]
MKNTQPLHVVYIVTKLELGGAQKVCLSLAHGINNSNYSTSLISGDQGPLVSHAKQLNNTFLLDSFKREVGLKSLLNEGKNFKRIIGILRNLKKKYPNIAVHTHSTKAGIIGRWAAFFAGIKTRIHTVHGFGFNDYQPKLRWFFIYALEWITALITTHFICVSNKDREEGCKRLPGFNNKSSIIRAAVEYKKFYIPARSLARMQPFRIGTISCFKPQKNLFDLLKAFQLATTLATKHTLELEIIGDGALRKELTNWIIQNNMQNSVRLLGWQHDVRPWLTSWDIFALSSLWEGLPCSVVEARLSKIPVVAYNVGGIHEIINDDVNGYLVEPGNWEKLGKIIATIANDTTLYQRLSQHQDSLTDFDTTAMLEHHKALYRQLFN